MKRELRVRLAYPTPQAMLADVAPRELQQAAAARVLSAARAWPTSAAPRSRAIAAQRHRRVGAPGPARQADRHPAAAVADAVRAVDRGARARRRWRWCSSSRSARADALGRLRVQRLGRRRYDAHVERTRRPAARARRDRAVGGAGGRRRRSRSRRSCSCPGHQPHDDAAVVRRARDRHRLSVLQALLRAAAGVPRHRVLVRHPDGVRGGARRRPPLGWWLLAINLFWVVAYDTEYAMVDRDDDMRHRHAHLGDHVRPLRRARGRAAATPSTSRAWCGSDA